MQLIWQDRQSLFEEYSRIRMNDDKVVEWCASLPYIGPTTKYHLAINLGADFCKPDVHLSRLATHQNVAVPDLCRRLARFEGYFSVDGERVNVNRISLVYRILWNALKDKILEMQC